MDPLPARSVIVRHGAPLPPPRPGVRHVRVRGVGVVVADDDLRRRIDRYFHWPMIVLALLVLPLLAIEFLYLDKLPERERNWVGLLCWIGFGMIWLAFLIEFIIKIAIAESRTEYVRRNWLDVIIILVPMFRPLRLSSVVRSSRVFTLRGVGMKAARYVFVFIVGLDAAQPWLQKLGLKARPGRKDPEKMTRHELMTEVRKLRCLADEWEHWHACEQDFLRERGTQCDPRPAPKIEAEVPARPEPGIQEGEALSPNP